MTVEIPPPIKPSQVFFGDNFINGVRPKKKPNIYAITSFMTIILTGTMNLKTIDIINRISRYLTYTIYSIVLIDNIHTISILRIYSG